MNEIRMYVERLFEGRVLTSDMIELKEEIYGNLVARYEDYIAEGMDPSEALEKTKASMTDIEDVLEGDAPIAAGVLGGKLGEFQGGAEEPAAETAVTDGAVDPTTPLTGVEGAEDAAPTRPGELGDAVAHPVRRGKDRPSWIPVVAVVVAVIGVAAALLVGLRPFGSRPVVSEPGDSADWSDEGGSFISAPPHEGQIIHVQDGRVYFEGVIADGLIESVHEAGYTDIADRLGMKLEDAARVEDLIRHLPMGEWSGAIDATLGPGVLAFAFRDLPDSLDGDAVEVALAYDVTALFCALPELDEIRITTTEAPDPLDFDEDDLDEERYVFTRSDVEQRYGVPLDGDLVNESGWVQIKRDNLYRNGFAEAMVEFAEQG
ncbi:MAG: permease prefix domain 1-containing protein [Collinsella sp.]|nr:permease prefix domain 1-containing protein [Collinsella sp.]